MRKLILTLAVFVFATVSHAQLVVDTASNWQQLIPTILGGGCVQIFNVSYNSNQTAAARYVSLNNFMGISNGLLISTGEARLADGLNTSTAAGTDLNSPGDATLDSVVQGAGTHDAVVLEFDFVSPVDDSVFVKYVFASEEYPEFVGSQYNDVFGFFVSGPGINGVQNIAKIPGTNTPVAINNVNQGAFPQYYVDNTNGLECQYDGYTTPFTAFFFAQAGVTYHLKIAIADVGDGIYDSGVLLQSYPGTWDDLSGTITHLGQPATAGIVELFGFNVAEMAGNLVATETIAPNGVYSFLNVPSGAYLLRSTLDPVLYPGTFPKYYNNSPLWTGAEILTFPCDSFTVDMQLMVLGTGTGHVSGTINYTSDHFKVTNGGAPLEGVNVFLINSDDQTVAGYCQTDSAGNYSFTNLKLGYYGVYVDIPAMLQDGVREVAIPNPAAEYTGNNYFVSDKIYIEDIEVPRDEIFLYPNPVNTSLNMKINLLQTGKVSIDLFDLAGRKAGNLYTGQMKKGFNTFETDISTLPAGVYYVRTQIGDDTHTLKLVKTSN